jgi:cysteine desulfurase
MIYLDYAANTPVDSEVMSCFIDMNNRFFANPNSTHTLGQEARNKLESVMDVSDAGYARKPAPLSFVWMTKE